MLTFVRDDFLGGEVKALDKTFTWTADPAGVNKRRAIERAERYFEENKGSKDPEHFNPDGRKKTFEESQRYLAERESTQQQIDCEIESRKPVDSNHYRRLYEKEKQLGARSGFPGDIREHERRLKMLRDSADEFDVKAKEERDAKRRERSMKNDKRWKDTFETLQVTRKKADTEDVEIVDKALQYLNAGLVDESIEIVAPVLDKQLAEFADQETDALQRGAQAAKDVLESKQNQAELQRHRDTLANNDGE